MSTEKFNVSGYDAFRASNYDDESKLDKGNREQHKLYLHDVLLYANTKPRKFLELGCGTAYFTSVFYELYPDIKGVLVDGSNEMLKIAAEKYADTAFSIHFENFLFEDINWDQLGHNFDIVFSSLSIHHLTDENKWQLFRDIYEGLTPNGIFILYDVFKPVDQKSFDVLEFLACMDSRRRLVEDLGVDLDIDELKISNIIENDRRIKHAEGDKEACLNDQLYYLKKAGFTGITTIFQDARFAGIVAFKSDKK